MVNYFEMRNDWKIIVWNVMEDDVDKVSVYVDGFIDNHPVNVVINMTLGVGGLIILDDEDEPIVTRIMPCNFGYTSPQFHRCPNSIKNILVKDSVNRVLNLALEWNELEKKAA